MSSKIEKVLVLAAAISAIVLAGIHLAWQDEVAKLESGLQISMLTHGQAVSRCVVDAVECARADLLGWRVEQNGAAVEDATKQAWLFLVLAIGVPCALLTMRMGVRRLSRSGRRNAASDQPVIV